MFKVLENQIFWKEVLLKHDIKRYIVLAFTYDFFDAF